MSVKYFTKWFWTRGGNHKPCKADVGVISWLWRLAWFWPLSRPIIWECHSPCDALLSAIVVPFFCSKRSLNHEPWSFKDYWRFLRTNYEKMVVKASDVWATRLAELWRIARIYWSTDLEGCSVYKDGFFPGDRLCKRLSDGSRHEGTPTVSYQLHFDCC